MSSIRSHLITSFLYKNIQKEIRPLTNSETQHLYRIIDVNKDVPFIKVFFVFVMNGNLSIVCPNKEPASNNEKSLQFQTWGGF
ncbi:hypothetical protein RCL_jg8952.t1 [Rhizophagus clarus]|uniref:Uncharacterized protein n=1 Tax=Rhizophagus clarus TaxID=94130 RepID=A0A8H3QFV3_9GLOM|nr:hypothetical protein RCL_jg8952.t1 [Rhizophagus clarus]